MLDFCIWLLLGFFLGITGMLGVTSGNMLHAREISLFCALFCGILCCIKAFYIYPTRSVP